MPRPPEAAPDFRYADADDGDLHLIEGARVFAGAVEIAPVGGGGGGGGTVASIVEGVGVNIDSSDPVNPIISIGQDVSKTVQPDFNGINVQAPSGAGLLVDYRGNDPDGDGGVYIDAGDGAIIAFRARPGGVLTNRIVINADGSVSIYGNVDVNGYLNLVSGLRSTSDLYIDTETTGDIWFRVGFLPAIHVKNGTGEVTFPNGGLVIPNSKAQSRGFFAYDGNLTGPGSSQRKNFSMCYDESYNYESFIDSVFSAGDPAANITAFFVCNSIIGGHTRVLDLRGDGQAEIVSGDLVLKAAGKTIRDGAGKNLLPAYKAYRAIISQSEFGMVTVHEGENHTGAAITWGSDVAPGVIIGTADAPIFDVTKTFVNIGPIPQDPQLGNNYDVGYFIVSPTQIKVSSWWKQAGMLDQLIDGVLTNTPIEILNYP